MGTRYVVISRGDPRQSEMTNMSYPHRSTPPQPPGKPPSSHKAGTTRWTMPHVGQKYHDVKHQSEMANIPNIPLSSYRSMPPQPPRKPPSFHEAWGWNHTMKYSTRRTDESRPRSSKSLTFPSWFVVQDLCEYRSNPGNICHHAYT